jgi:hypothetical protein
MLMGLPTPIRKMLVWAAQDPLAFFSYPWVRYQERRFLSMGERNIRHAKRRFRIAIAPQGIRRPAARPSHEA